ncbi:CheY-like chemotaxis protein [Bradyrhizobium elkanii]|nr:CheY-like chemotaxis protein [Bradyrhizobium elkanii]
MARKLIVLIVEDEYLIRLSAAEMVRELGFEVVEAVDADHAIDLLETTADIAIVFTDIQMPGSMDGLRRLALVRNRWPPIALLVTSGQVEPAIEDLPAGALAAREAARTSLASERETSELREQFIAVVGHDLRNPLASVSARARILGREAQTEEQHQVAAMTQTTVMRTAGLIDNVLDFARGRLGGNVTLQQVVDELRPSSPDREIDSDSAAAKVSFMAVIAEC